MNKAELSAKWGKYCDTNTLVDDVMELLRVNGHRSSVHGVCKLLDAFFTNKEPLIKLVASSNHYIGNLRISTKQSFDRNINGNDIRNFFYYHGKEFVSDTPYSRVDDDGKQMLDYMKADAKFCNLSDIVGNKSMIEMIDKLRQFRADGVTVASFNRNQEINNYIAFFRQHPYSTVQYDREPVYDKKAPAFKTGMKTSRAFNAFCHYYGFDKRDTYNKSFATYADLVSALKRNMDFVISLNPLDYLTMSNGVSWHSCHNIADGGYKGGCLSYMLDETSLITYVVFDINSDAKIHTIPKYYRQMIHYKDDMFMQNRLYPQGNDGASDLYERFRGFVTEEFNEILGIEGDWDVEDGPNSCRGHVSSAGVHYRDYNYNNRCNIFYPHSKASTASNTVMIVGHEGICCHCGRSFTESGRLSHRECTVRE